MSQVMSNAGDTDALAAEYVLGTLDSDERALAQGLLAEDEAFVGKVKVWERRLGELHLMVEPIEPERGIWERIKAKIPEVQQAPEIKAPEIKAPEPPVVEPPSPPTAPEVVMPSPDAAPATAPDVPPAAHADTAAVSPPPDMIAPAMPPPEAAAPRTLVAPALSPDTAQPPVVAPTPVLTAGVTRALPVIAEDKILVLGRRLTRWRAFAALMTLVVLAVAALLAAWRFVPDRVPPVLQPIEVMRLVGVDFRPPPPPPRPKPPPESEFDE
jgi:hypothetical protein